MSPPRVCAFALLCFVTTIRGETMAFEMYKPGALRDAWSSAMTHSGGAPRWEVIPDESAPNTRNVLAQLSDEKTNGRDPLAIYETASSRGRGECSLQIRSRFVDQACGIV
jgi:hypothetical protein